jgi:sigma-E factor negative regulatory protein RseC
VILERGKISDITDAHAWVECQSRSACERCASGKGCGGGVLGALLGDRLHKIKVTSHIPGLKVGDQVELGMSAADLLGAAMLVYLLPLSGLLLGALAGGVLAGFSNDMVTIFGALAGLALGGLVTRRINHAKRWSLQPKILRILGSCQTGPESVDAEGGPL